VQCPPPERFWAQHHDGMYVSRDGCAKWVELGESGERLVKRDRQSLG
jgi:hypothetical protein